MSSDHDAAKPEKGVNRRSFLQTSGGVATGLAVTTVPSLALAAPALASGSADKLGERVHPAGDVPSEPVMAYVHDAEKGEVTVLQGTVEKTYRDPVLAKRLLDAARA
ncbi:MAG: twin-arginine translocation signal domain-containing protein [Solirubrobacteraceae bacterium]